MSGPQVLLAADQAAAESAEESYRAGKLEEVIVTAQKREENLQATPLSVTAFTAASLAQLNASALNEIGSATPNMLFNQNGSSAVVFIRGVGQSDSVVTADPGVAIYVDGVYAPRMFGDMTDLLDVERIEVLRGPQGTLFGKNAIGGAVSVVTKTPENEFYGTFEARAGSRNRMDAGGFLNVPLVDDKLAASIAVSARSQDGYIDLPQQGSEAGDIDHQSVRAKLRWNVSDDLDATLGTEYYRQREKGIAPQALDIDGNAGITALWNGFVGGPSGTQYDDRWLAPKYTSNGTAPQYDDLYVRGASLTLSRRLDSGVLKSISAYRDIDNRANSDIDASPLPITENPYSQSSRTFTQELQLSQKLFADRLDNTLGVFFLREHAQDWQQVLFETGLYEALQGAGLAMLAAATNITQDNARDQVARSYAIYDQGTYHFTEALGVSVGLRYTRESKDDRLYVFYPDQNLVGVDQSISQSWTSVTPKVSLQYQFTPTNLFYVSAAEGFKSGGMNGRPTTNAAVLPFGPEKLWNFEAGLKTQWLEDRLRLNVSVYRMQYRDIQLQTLSVTPSGAQLIITSNPGDGRMNGVEGELAFKPIESLTLSASAGYNDFEYTRMQPGSQVSASNELPFTPTLTYNLGAQWALPLPEAAGQLTLGANYSHRSKVYLEAANIEELAQSDFGLLSARASWLSPDRQWEVYGYGTNLTDTAYRVFGVSQLDSFGWQAAGYAPPREVGLGLRVNF